MSHVCHHCGTVWADDPKIGRGAMCRKCGKALHCCTNCRFHNPAKHNKCDEPAAEWVRDKIGANFCEYFEWSVAGAKASADTARKQSLEDKIKSLFKD